MIQDVKNPRVLLEEINQHITACPIGWHEGALLRHRDTTDGEIIDWLDKLKRLSQTVVSQPQDEAITAPGTPSTVWERRPIGPSPRFQQLANRLRELISALQAEGVTIEQQTPLFNSAFNLGIVMTPANIDALSKLYPNVADHDIREPLKLISRLLKEAANIVGDNKSINNTLHVHIDDWLARAQRQIKHEDEYAMIKLTLLAPSEINGIEQFNVQVEECATVKDIVVLAAPTP